MSPIVGYHATLRKCRDAITQNGLLGNQPNKSRPWGVYVFREDGSFAHPARALITWGAAKAQDVWEVCYIGPIVEDTYVMNGMVFLESAEHVSLVTCN